VCVFRFDLLLGHPCRRQCFTQRLDVGGELIEPTAGVILLPENNTYTTLMSTRLSANIKWRIHIVLKTRQTSDVQPTCVLLFRTTNNALGMNITPDIPFLNIYNPFTSARMRAYLEKHSRMSLDTNDYFVKHISHLSKSVVIVVLV